jgi:hypothetical protein
MFNHLHPECQTDEIYLCNIDDPFYTSLLGVRYGNIAYDINGDIIPYMTPMFVSKKQNDNIDRFMGYNKGYYGKKA